MIFQIMVKNEMSMLNEVKEIICPIKQMTLKKYKRISDIKTAEIIFSALAWTP